MIVTRTEIADLIGDVFAEPAVSKGRLVAQATARQGRTPVVNLLEGLQERTYNSLRDLWGQLPEVPIGD